MSNHSKWLVLVAMLICQPVFGASDWWQIESTQIIPGHTAIGFYADGEGLDWTGAVLRIDLTSGSAYQHAFGGDPPPSPFFFPTFPSLLYDTYVGILNDNTAGIAGGAGDLGGGPLSLDAPQISVSWFNNATDDTGPVKIANITLSNDASGTWELITSYAGGVLLQSSGTFEGIPEPASAGLFGIGSAVLLRRR